LAQRSRSPGRSDVSHGAPDTESWAWCEVRWRRGYISGAFVALRQGDAPEEIGRSPSFRWRSGGPVPPELPEIASCLAALETDLATEGWERIDHERSDWCALQFRRRLIPLRYRIDHYAVAPDEQSIAWLSEAMETTAASAADGLASAAGGSDEPRPASLGPDAVESSAGGESAKVVAIREAAKRLEAKRRNAKRREAQRLRAERREAEQRQAEAAQREAERREAKRRETELHEAKRREAERRQVEAERREAERREARRRETELSEAKRREAERRQAEAAQREAERREAEQRQAEGAQREAERREAKRREAEQRQAETAQREAKRHEAEQRRAEQLKAEQPVVERTEVERLEPERADGLPLHGRLSAYSAKSDSQTEIRALFQPKKKPQREHRFKQKRPYRY
jgi:hypothetical protein